ncbi:response regulator [Paenibacillus alkalitolerans]|uniref:response regulator n=1 Tax=Paenibacillus alkalitolerans TaxID=2799335 RepID=UPI0018F63CBA|nr:response regulator [Paenibacillus alkalitolerans]
MKVMLVDDEILAVQHIRNMLDWEACGCKIVGEHTNPRRALESLDQAKPDLVIADIKMPGMDGLELSQRILEKHPRTKIVLLTSYKEFEYAKAALTIGVDNYLLKHEINAGALRSELQRIKEMLDRERLRTKAFRSETLRNLLTGRLQEQELLRLREDDSFFAPGRRFALFLIRFDVPFPMHIPGLPAGDPAPAEPPDLSGCISHQPSFQETIRMESNLWVAVAESPASVSRKQRRERLHEAASSLHRVIKASLGRTASICIADEIKADAEASPTYHAAAALQKNAFMYGCANTFLLGEEPSSGSAPDSGNEEQVRKELERAAQWAEALDIEKMAGALERTFRIAAERRSAALLHDLCDRWMQLLHTMRTGYQLCGLDELYQDGAIDPNEWKTVGHIRDWFARLFRESALQADEAAKLSGKVRQAIEYMQKHYPEDITAETIASALHMSGDRLRHLFKEETGHTLLEHLTRIRLEQAKKLLAEGSCKVYEIAGMVGYGNSQYFSQVFRKGVGVSPNEYAETKGRLPR